MSNSDHSTHSHQMRGFIFALVGGILWGFSGACGQFLFSIGESVNSSWLTVTRLLFSGIILIAFSLIVPERRATILDVWKQPKDAVRLLVFSLLGITSCQFTYLTAISYSNAGTATVLQYLGPVLIMVISCIMALRLPTVKEVIALILAVGGTFLLATHGNPNSLAISQNGLIWGLLSAVALVLYTMLPGDLIRRYGSTTIVGFGMLIGGIFLFFVFGYWKYQITLNTAGILAIAAIVIFGTALAFTLYLQGVSDIGSVKASLIASVEPVSATIFSAVWLGTKFTGIDVVGLVMILATVVLLTKKPKENTETKSES